MKKVSQKIPKEQVLIMVTALTMLETAIGTLKTDDQEVRYKLFDIATLKALLNTSEVVVELPFELYENFTALNGIDFPLYSE
jgi:hypothetical protein